MQIKTYAWLLAALTSLGAAHALSVDEYVKQVTGQNDAARASDLTSRGALLRQNEASLPFTTNFFINADYMDDQRLTGAPVFQGTGTRVRRFESGFSQRFRLGLDASLSYLHQHTNISGVDPQLVRFHNFHDQQFQLKLAQSLWRNWMGAEAAAQETAQHEAARALSHAEQFKLRLLESDARIAYLNLLQARSNVDIQVKAVERAEKIRASNKRKADRQLSDRIDLLQSEANLEFRQLQLRQARQDLARLSRAFNILRGVDGDKIEKQLISVITREEIERLSIPERVEIREDVKAMLSQALAERAQADAASELSRPKLEIFAQLSTNGKDDRWVRAWEQSATNTYTQNSIGLRFVAPLDIGLLQDNRAGRRMEAQAADLRYKRKAYEVERDWEDTMARFHDAQLRLKLSHKIEAAQKAKTVHERNRLSQGLTTTFQSLTFEQEYADAQLNRLRAETEILTLHARLRLFANK